MIGIEKIPNIYKATSSAIQNNSSHKHSFPSFSKNISSHKNGEFSNSHIIHFCNDNKSNFKYLTKSNSHNNKNISANIDTNHITPLFTSVEKCNLFFPNKNSTSISKENT